MKHWRWLGILVLAACNLQPSTQAPPQQKPVGLLKVTITGIGEGASPEGEGATATAEWVHGASSGVNGQAATVVPVNGSNALNDVQFTRSSVSFHDDLINNTRYVVATFSLTNRMNVGFSNLTLYAVHVPGTTQGGTGVVAMRDATNTLITDEAKYRALKPSHGMMAGVGNLVVNPNVADLQWITGQEASSVKSQGVSQGQIGSTATVLEYGFVARSLSNTRNILARNTPTDCTDNSCMGTITLAYSFPLSPPDPTRFSLYFLVGDESDAHVSQSLEEQGVNTAAGIAALPGIFSQVRTLQSNAYTGANENNLCSVRTAIPTATAPGNLYLPTTIPSAPGSLDVCFGTGGKVTTGIATGHDWATAIALQSDGKIVAAGLRGTQPNTDIALARYNQSGSLDTSFGTGGKVITAIGTSTDEANSLAIQSDGKIVVAGYTSTGGFYDFALVRYNSNGSLDTSFDTDGIVITDFGTGADQAFSIAIQPNGRIVVAGCTNCQGGSDFALARYNTDGSLDTTFDGDGKVTTDIASFSRDFGYAVAIQSDGKIVVGGHNSVFGSDTSFALARYNPGGSLDTTFDGDGKATTSISPGLDIAYSMAIQSDGKIVLAGCNVCGTTNSDFVLVRYNPNGSPDTTFDGDGIVTTGIGTSFEDARALTLQSDGKIVAAGYSYNGNNANFALARYNPGGSLDTTFDGDGKVTTVVGLSGDIVYSIATQSDGKIVVGGSSNNGSNGDFALARYNP